MRAHEVFSSVWLLILDLTFAETLLIKILMVMELWIFNRVMLKADEEITGKLERDLSKRIRLFDQI